MTNWRKFLDTLSKMPLVEENLEEKIAALQQNTPAVPYTPPAAPYIPPQQYTPPATPYVPPQTNQQPRQSDSGAYGIIAIGFALLLGFGALMGAPKFLNLNGQDNRSAQESRSSGSYDSEEDDSLPSGVRRIRPSREATPLEKKISAAKQNAVKVYTAYRIESKRMLRRYGGNQFGGQDAYELGNALMAANEAMAKYKSIMEEWNDSHKDTPGARLYDLKKETDAIVVYAEKNS